MSTTAQLLPVEVRRGDPGLLQEFIALPGVLLTGHFELLSGVHTDRFVAFSAVAERDRALDAIAAWLLPSVGPHLPDAVVAPRTAGVALGYTLARQLGVPLHLASVDTGGRPNGILGDQDLSNRRVLLVNDVVTTGQGLSALADVVARRGGTPVAASWFVRRTDVDVEALLDIPGIDVATIELGSWPSGECPDCSRGEPVTFGIDLN